MFSHIKDRVLRNINLSMAAMLFCAVIVVWANFNVKSWSKPYGVLKHDVINYYSFLPAAFIYKDLSFRFIDDNKKFFHDKIWVSETPEGQRYQKMTIGLSFMYAPFFLAGHLTALLSSAEPDGFSKPYMFFLHFSAFFYLMLGMFFLRKLLLRYFDDWIVAIVLVSILFGTNLFYYVNREAGMPHAFNFSLFSIFAWLTVRWYESRSTSLALAIGLVFGLIALIRPSNALIALFFILYDVKSLREFTLRPAFFLKHWHHILIITCSAIVVFIPQFILWKYQTGSWLWYSYGDEGFFFGNPQIINGLFSYRKGWLLYTPLMVFAIAGIFLLYRRQRQFFIPLHVFLVLNIYVVYSWWCWWYGGSFGSRPMIDSYPLMAIGLAGFLAWASKIEWRKKLAVTVITLFTLHGVFQTMQYIKGAIHFNSMTKSAYWSSFGKIFPDHWYYDMLEPPDYNAARKGIQAIAVHSKSIVLGSMECDYETLTPDGKFFYSTDKRFLLAKPNLRSTIHARSGEYSFKLTPENRYGSDFQIRARIGEVYNISVWRFPAGADGRLVFSGQHEKDFYKTARNPSLTDKNGWEKIETDILIPSGLPAMFRVYLYNPGDEAVWFDDLKITRIR